MGSEFPIFWAGPKCFQADLKITRSDNCFSRSDHFFYRSNNSWADLILGRSEKLFKQTVLESLDHFQADLEIWAARVWNPCFDFYREYFTVNCGQTQIGVWGTFWRISYVISFTRWATNAFWGFCPLKVSPLKNSCVYCVDVMNVFFTTLVICYLSWGVVWDIIERGCRLNLDFYYYIILRGW